jgi:pSer/pThr/pTyr-binding forkhead associated (FHA) protein
VLLGGEAHPLAAGLVVGCDPGEAAGSVLRLGPGLAGVSRRHCTFLQGGGEVVLLDHSRHGSFVNAERVAERMRVHAGDRVRLGDPGVELALIAVPV